MNAETGSNNRAPYWAVADQATGNGRDYRKETKPLGVGGQADVLRAEHKATGILVAFKRLRSQMDRHIARMRREIEIGTSLRTHPNVMPVLDASPDHKWFVMPLAEATLEERRTTMNDDYDELRACLDAVASALQAAHDRRQTHRDVKPANILLLDGRWRLADWGLVRNPVGETTNSRRTGNSLGTAGFAAPELSTGEGAHDATPACDIYSLGQLIGWILTGEWPEANTPLLPSDPSWRHVVAECTRRDPARRPQDVQAFLALVDGELAPIEELPFEQAGRLRDGANEGDDSQLAALLALAANHPDDAELYIKVLAGLEAEPVARAVALDVDRLTSVVAAMADHRAQDPWPSWGQAAEVESWLLRVARAAAKEAEWRLLDAAATGFFQWIEGGYDQWGPLNSMKGWLRSANGESARHLAAMLRRFPGPALFYEELIDESRVSLDIRRALSQARRGTGNTDH